MKIKLIYMTLFTALLGIAALSAGCAKGGQNSADTLSSQTNPQNKAQATEGLQMQTTIAELTADLEETGKAALANPIKKATKEDIENMGITIALPENKEWIGDCAYSIINGETAQINYFDKIAQAEVSLRAGKNDIPIMAGIYYPFDESREEKWSARNIEGDKIIDISVQYAVSDQNQAGVLLSFSCNDFNYTLWSAVTDKNADISPLSKTAVYIAEHVK